MNKLVTEVRTHSRVSKGDFQPLLLTEPYMNLSIQLCVSISSGLRLRSISALVHNFNTRFSNGQLPGWYLQ